MLKANDYEFLITLYRSKNITQAAQTLFLSQPALTKRLQQIEQELGVLIVNRNVKGVQFTPEGQYVVRYAEQCVNEYKELKMALHGLQTEKDSTISIVSARTLAHELLPDLFANFLKVYPKTHLVLHAVGSRVRPAGAQRSGGHRFRLRGAALELPAGPHPHRGDDPPLPQTHLSLGAPLYVPH